MYFSTLMLLALSLGTSIANPTPLQNLVLHERRGTGGLSKRSRADPTLQVPVRIALAQNNINIGVDQLLDVSDPGSANFGKHLTAEEVGDLFRPSAISIEAVRTWLDGADIAMERHTLSGGKGWIKFYASIRELEGLLSTKYHMYEHSTTDDVHVGCDEYHLPAEMVPHIDFITPSVSTYGIGGSKNKQSKMRATTSHSKTALHPRNISVSGGSYIPCYTSVTPDCLRTLYGIPLGDSNMTGNEIGVFEYGDFYDQADLDLIFGAVAPYVPGGTHPILNGIDGGTVAPDTFTAGYESLLDFSIIFPLIHPQGAILYQVDDLKEFEINQQTSFHLGFGNTFLDALDASYCTFEGGDDPDLDPQYPDTGPNPPNSSGIPNGTWAQAEMCGTYTPTNVISISYGLAENQLSRSYLDRQCQEYMKLGLQGVTVIFSSGDFGVSSNGGLCIAPANETAGDNAGAFSPSYPASCPWVTTVGATQFNEDDKSETAASGPNGGWSGGGFSNYWPAPSYQQTTLAHYFTTTPPPYTNLTSYGTPYFNISGRGYPDVSAVGKNILTYINGTPLPQSGTSASAPIIASIITLINERRLKAGKSRVGFLNPTLYQNPQAFNDITTGSNPGCGVEGFDAVTGWDPVTGLGTPQFDKLLEVFMALP